MRGFDTVTQSMGALGKKRTLLEGATPWGRHILLDAQLWADRARCMHVASELVKEILMSMFMSLFIR